MATLVIVAMLCGASGRAESVYSEGFDYGTANGSLAGRNGGSGFSGAWTSGNPGITYASTGLSFSDLSVSGGSVTATGTNGIGNALFYRPLTSTLSGVYYGSFLSQVVDASQFGISNGMALGLPNTQFESGGFGMLAPRNSTALALSEGYASTFNGGTLNLRQTYLTLFKIDTAAMSIKGYLLSAGQYDMFKAGGITEAELDAATLGTSDGQLWARISITGFEPVTASHLNVLLNAGSGVSATLAEDEFRLSNTSLDEVTPSIPEPGSVFLLSIGIGLLATARKRKPFCLTLTILRTLTKAAGKGAERGHSLLLELTFGGPVSIVSTGAPGRGAGGRITEGGTGAETDLA